MSRVSGSQISCLTLALALLSTPFLAAQQAKEAAPLPVQIAAAKRIFISNGGVDGNSLEAFRRTGGSDQPYNQFYNAMKGWGRYELVAAPADADLVLEIRFAAPLTGCDKICSYAPQLGLTILDAKTHFTLWTLIEPVDGAFRKATWEKNFSKGMTNLMDDMRKLAGQHEAEEATKR